MAGAHALAAAGRLGRALTATVVVIAALVAAVVVAGALAPVSAAAVSGPESWKCDSKRLGLEKVVVARAPVQASERFSTGRGISSRPDARDKWVPVILVHGWVSRATHPDSDGTDATRGAFSGPINLSPNAFSQADGKLTLVGQLQDIPGAAVFTYDYHPYSGRWVTDKHLGPGLAKVVDCLAKASGEKVVLVGHSMGGLIARYAAAAPGPGGAKDRSGQISRIVMLGTPNTGSVSAMLVADVVDAVPGQVGAVIRLLLSACGSATSADLAGTVCGVAPVVGAFQGDAGRALRYKSKELAALARVPEAIPVSALAGETNYAVPKLGWFALPWDTTDVPVGDVIVTSGSAFSGGREKRDIACRYQLNPVRGESDQIGLLMQVVGKGEVAGDPVGSASGPCFHTSLMRAQELANEVAGVVADDIGDRYVSRADLLTAPVPALRGNPAGDLVDGELPVAGGGFVALERAGGAAPALGDLTGDGRGDAAAVISATSGAGGADQNVIAYGKRNRRLIRLAEFDPAQVRSGTYHVQVTGMIIKAGAIELSWSTQVAGSGPGPDLAATLRLQGSRLVASNVRELDGSTADALPPYPQTEAAGFELEAFLQRNGLRVVKPPIETGCEQMVVLGADLGAGNVDLYLGESLRPPQVGVC